MLDVDEHRLLIGRHADAGDLAAARAGEEALELAGRATRPSSITAPQRSTTQTCIARLDKSMPMIAEPFMDLPSCRMAIAAANGGPLSSPYHRIGKVHPIMVRDAHLRRFAATEGSSP